MIREEANELQHSKLVISSEALEEFRELFRSWLDGNLGCLEEGGLGDCPALAAAVLRWSRQVAR